MNQTTCLAVLAMAILLCTSVFGQSNSWNTGGNSNLAPNCFIGTNDPVPLVFKSGGTVQLKIGFDGLIKATGLSGNGMSYLTLGPNGTLVRQSDPGADSLFDCSTKLWKANGNFLTPDCFIGSVNEEPLRLFTHNSERLRVTESGHIGIGTTTPKGLFQIGDYMPLVVSTRQNGPSDTRYLIGFNTFLDGTTAKLINSGPGAMLNWDAAFADICLGVSQGGSAGQSAAIPVTLAVGANGKVGVGIRQQEALLHVFGGNGDADLRIHASNQSHAPRIDFWTGAPNTNSAAALGTLKANIHQNSGRAQLEMEVNPGGNQTSSLRVFRVDKEDAVFSTRLGIGTAPDPQDRLTVDGAGRFTQAGSPGNYIHLSHDGSDAILECNAASNSNNGTPHLRINPNGNPSEFGGDVLLNANLGLGTSDFNDTGNGKTYRLSVDGRIRAREVKVYSGWADHVFEPAYELLPLGEVKVFIATHGHLPGMPTAEEVQTNGVEVGATQALLLEKIEELTLHLIKLEEDNRLLSARLEAIEP